MQVVAIDAFSFLQFFLLLAYFFLFGVFNTGVPLLNPCPIHVTFNVKVNVFYSLQSFDCLFIFAYLEHLTPGYPHYAVSPRAPLQNFYPFYLFLLAGKWIILFFVIC